MNTKQRRQDDAPDETPRDDVDASEAVDGQGTLDADVVDAEPTDPVHELQDRVKRLQAEFLNETKRIQRQADESRKYAVEGLVMDLLPVFDALHSAQQGLATSEAGVDAVRQGLDLVEKSLLDVLARHGIEPIEAAEAVFDPAQHEAIFVVEHPDLPAGTVAQVLRPGFTLNGRVVRPVHVAVTKDKDPAADA